MQVPPRWCVDKMDCWEALVDVWCSPEWLVEQQSAKDKRDQMEGVPHHQGNSNLFEYGNNWAHHHKKPVPSLFDLYGMAHMAPYKKAKPFTESDLDHLESFTNISSHHKLVKYRDEGKARKGEDFNPSQDPFDTELVMISGGGRSHGSQGISDGLIRCPKTLPQIKKRLSSSDPQITPRARLAELAMAALVEKERLKTQTLLEEAKREAAEREREMEERTTKLLEEERNRNDNANRALYKLIVAPPPMLQIASATTVSLI
ncbi:uncharacterized protein [Triticum aestivum]|uniref:uncharacterized protein n=1 Tax=Triticum aestivum TaxID=4565 RepID=UPI001D029249|nr:uncharacterized protein LOC123157902 [Triticum aestivum]